MDIITLINKYVSGFLKAEEEFLEHLDSLLLRLKKQSAD